VQHDIVSDLGGFDQLTEMQKQLVRPIDEYKRTILQLRVIRVGSTLRPACPLNLRSLLILRIRVRP